MSTSTARLRGAVLAGGESRRMGHDKALLLVDGEPLWRRQLDLLSAAGAEPVTVIRRRGQIALSPDVPLLTDTFQDAGPLAGLHAALAACPPGDWVAILAVDMPALDVTWFEALQRECTPGAGAVMQHQGEENYFEPLAAIYPQAALAFAEAKLRDHDYSLQNLVRTLIEAKRMNVLPLIPGSNRAMNCNTPEDFRDFATATYSDPASFKRRF